MVKKEKINLQEFAIKQLEQVKDFYIKDPSLMMEQYEHEKTTIQEYVDRELLELIQNADDAAITARKPKAFIYLEDSTLIVANTGQKFTEGGLDSLLHSDLSPKYKEKNQIGNKGLGFRAILGWADKVTIISGDLQIGFSKKNSISVLEELKLANPSIREKIFARYKRDEEAIALLRCPEIIEELAIPEIFKEYDTLIILDLKEQVEVLVEKQLLNTIDDEMMLFLNHLDTIEIQTPHIRQTLKRKLLKSERLTENSFLKRIKVSKIDAETQQSEWNIYGVEGTHKPDDPKVDEKNYELAVAWQDELKESKNVLHSFFRTDVSFKFPGILHGTFELSSNRNELIKGKGHNVFLFRKMADLLADASQIIADNEKNYANYNALKLSMIDFSNLSNLIKESDFESVLKEALKNRKIFPTIGNKYVMWNEETKPVYYKEDVFSIHLNPMKFINLLKFCADEALNDFICSLTPTYRYNINDIIEDIAQKKEQLSIGEYAKLIITIHEYVNERSDIESQSLFYDGKMNLLSFNEPIFLPGTSHQYDLPADLGVQIISAPLALEILKISHCENFSGLPGMFGNYPLKEYKFTEVVEILIHHYSDAKSSPPSVITLNQQLFKLWTAEQDPGTRWKGSSVFLFDKKGSRKPARELYFGKDYNNPLTEEIYHYDKSKIVASHKKFKVESLAEDQWKNYLEWLGVEFWPRKIFLNRIPEPYVNYCLRNYNYKNNIESYRFRNYSDFRSHNFQYGDVQIQSLEGLADILNKNSFESIIKLLNANKDLLSIIIEDREPQGSYIGICIDSDRSYRYMYSSTIKSFIKWSFLTAPWIETESGLKQSPDLCTTASNVNSDFSPLIEKPAINYDRFIKIGLKRDRIDYFLNEVGVHKSINTFSTNVLYSILLQLPKIDSEKKKAKTIYNQLAANCDEKFLARLDKTDELYKEFHLNGNVFCKSGEYVPIKKAFYVNDKRYGENVIKHFETIEIDKRRGKENVFNLFGVVPLDKLELTLAETPSLHFLNSGFISEIESFKPFVYVLRKEVDGGWEKSTIKETKLRLVTELTLQLIKEGIPKSINLNDYEYFYYKKISTVFIKAPENLIEISELKEDFRFCTTIAEAFSAILDVDTHRQQIRDLFSRSSNGREEFLRIDLDDLNLQKLKEARVNLGTASNPRLEFWKSFSKCLKAKKFVPERDSDTELLEYLRRTFPQYDEIISMVFNEINYPEINEEISCEWVVRLFQFTGLTIRKFNEFHYPAIDIKELYEINFKRSIERNRSIFKSLYHSKCSLDTSLKEEFLNGIHEYGAFQPNVVNEVTFNVDEDLTEQVKARFGINLTGKGQTSDIDDKYLDNLASLWQSSQQLITERKLFDQFIGEDNITQSLLYFSDQLSTIHGRLKSWLGKTPTNNSGESASSKSKRIIFGDKPLFYENFSDLKRQLETILDDDGLKGITSSIIRTESAAVHTGFNPTNNTSTSSRKPKVPKEEVGFLGEYLVYRFLLKTLDAKESVKWVSDYAKECGINLNGKDGFGYDFEYIPNGAKHPRYVEVKVVGSEDAFHISSNEVRSGEKYKKNYELFLVRNLGTPTKARIERIQGLFDYKGKGQSFNNNDLFSVINEKFIIVFNKVD